ncbi:glycoside hydrolase family 32 protein [Mesobacillus foraminis]|uniref:glycoside hydrolase family 32 protein n=1 Tax=Mesobacillus foraminis TaxID=279826 RepID=UPI001BE987F6|nr:glycoside hydrolase family 32 protein [Mesobacillus foraminis]MBT2755806.1 glycoside hydrolase family 32 protein [Mesobacillus foraminis]
MLNLYNQKHRPQFHFSPEEKWMNDPNGMVFFNGEYHLFYQHHPFGTTWGPMHWGHAVSKDLIHWEHLPIALHPDEHGAIFSGSAVVDWNDTTDFFDGEAGLVAIYTSADHYPDSDRPRQRQSLAYSKDNGRTWMKYEGNPVLSDEKITDYRDPKVFWHNESNKWVMILATGQSVTLYTSTNLKEWEFASEFGRTAGSHDGVWECPDLFELPVDGEANDNRWVMLVSIGDNPDFPEGSRTQYFVGQFDGRTFKNENSDDTILWLDFGRDNYAGVSWSDLPKEDGRRIYLGWMSNWRYANQVPTEEWRSAMTLPRELSLARTESGIRLVQKVVSEIKSIREHTEVIQDLTVKSDSTVTIDMLSPLMEVNAVFEKKDSAAFGIIFKNAVQEWTVIQYDAESEKIMVDRRQAGISLFSESFPAIQETMLKMEEGKIHLQIFMDTSSIEAVANDGKAVCTSLVFPNQPYDKIVLFSDNGETQVPSLKLTSLNSIWG